MAAMSEAEHKATGLELILPDPEFIASLLGESRRPEPQEADDDGYEPPRAA